MARTDASIVNDIEDEITDADTCIERVHGLVAQLSGPFEELKDATRGARQSMRELNDALLDALSELKQ